MCAEFDSIESICLIYVSCISLFLAGVFFEICHMFNFQQEYISLAALVRKVGGWRVCAESDTIGNPEK